MKTTVLALALFLATATAQAQFSTADIQYWVGSGADSSVLVIDFLDGSSDPSYAWGYLHDGTATAQDMITAIDAADIDLEIDMAGGFINTISFNSHLGEGGVPNYWGSWTGTSIADMAMNGGASEPLSNGEWFGCSYTDFAPAIPPTEPQAAPAPSFTAADVDFWVGTGAHEAILVIDFLDGTSVSSYAWGFRFDGSTTGEAMLNAIDAADAELTIGWSSGFLNDITYNGHVGIGGSPDYWGTWSGSDIGNWISNLGTGTAVNDGELFGCSYMDFAPMIAPGFPTAAALPTAIVEVDDAPITIYPQPATDILYVNTGHDARNVQVYDLTGKRLLQLPVGVGTRSIDVGAWPTGLYVLQAGRVKRTIAVQ
jgi:hypothetical protein